MADKSDVIDKAIIKVGDSVIEISGGIQADALKKMIKELDVRLTMLERSCASRGIGHYNFAQKNFIPPK